MHLYEQGLMRLPDDEIIDKAREEDRIILTIDLDFGFLLAMSKAKLPSVITFRQADKKPDVINQRLADLLPQCKDDLEAGAIISVGDADFRVRRLPIE